MKTERFKQDGIYFLVHDYSLAESIGTYSVRFLKYVKYSEKKYFFVDLFRKDTDYRFAPNDSRLPRLVLLKVMSESELENLYNQMSSVRTVFNEEWKVLNNQITVLKSQINIKIEKTKDTVLNLIENFKENIK